MNTSKLTAADRFALGALGVTSLATAAAYRSLPARVATHFNWRGQPDSWQPRAVAAIVLPALAVALFVLFRVVLTRRRSERSGAAVDLCWDRGIHVHIARFSSWLREEPCVRHDPGHLHRVWRTVRGPRARHAARAPEPVRRRAYPVDDALARGVVTHPAPGRLVVRGAGGLLVAVVAMLAPQVALAVLVLAHARHHRGHAALQLAPRGDPGSLTCGSSAGERA